jgi:hypothetical protein
MLLRRRPIRKSFFEVNNLKSADELSEKEKKERDENHKSVKNSRIYNRIDNKMIPWQRALVNEYGWAAYIDAEMAALNANNRDEMERILENERQRKTRRFA